MCADNIKDKCCMFVYIRAHSYGNDYNDVDDDNDKNSVPIMMIGMRLC